MTRVCLMRRVLLRGALIRFFSLDFRWCWTWLDKSNLFKTNIKNCRVKFDQSTYNNSILDLQMRSIRYNWSTFPSFSTRLIFLYLFIWLISQSSNNLGFILLSKWSVRKSLDIIYRIRVLRWWLAYSTGVSIHLATNHFHFSFVMSITPLKHLLLLDFSINWFRSHIRDH